MIHARRRLQQTEEGEQEVEQEGSAGVQVLVTCESRVDGPLRARLVEAAGIPPAQFIPPQTLLWYLTDDTAVQRVAAVPGVVCVALRPRALRMLRSALLEHHPRLRHQRCQRFALIPVLCRLPSRLLGGPLL